MEHKENKDLIQLSPLANALATAIEEIKPRVEPDDYTKLTVSRAVSFMALAYERLRNVIEYREDHLIRRAAIERILRRRLAINPSGANEAENLLRELLWARYFPKNSLGEDDADTIQRILDRYAQLKEKLLFKRSEEWKNYLSQFLFDFITCEIEESLSQDVSAQQSAFTYFIFQTLQHTVRFDDLPADQKDSLLYVAIEQEYRKSDRSYQRYHLFCLFFQRLSEYNEKDLEELTPRLPNIMKHIDDLIHNPNGHKLRSYIKKQLPAFHILFEVLQKNKELPKAILTSRTELLKAVEESCQDNYRRIKEKMRLMTIRSVIYLIFLKLIVTVFFEYPLIKLFSDNSSLLPVIANTIFPPLFVLMIVLWFRLPDDENTKRIFQRIVQLINADTSFEHQVALVARKVRQQNAFAKGFYTVLYSTGLVAFVVALLGGLSFLNFHPVSQVTFIFFSCVACYFAFRINQLVKEYTLVEKPGILDPILEFFYLPMVSVGKELDKAVSKLNFFTLIFDVLIEIPFKLVIEVIEEWFSYMKNKKEEIV